MILANKGNLFSKLLLLSKILRIVLSENKDTISVGCITNYP